MIVDSNATIGLFWLTALCTSGDIVKEEARILVNERYLLGPSRAGNIREEALTAKFFARDAPRHPARACAHFAKFILLLVAES